MRRIWKEESGIMTLEWGLLLAVLVIGIIGGIAILRDGLIVEAGETAEAVLNVDDSFNVAKPLTLTLTNMQMKTGTELASGTFVGFAKTATTNSAITAYQD